MSAKREYTEVYRDPWWDEKTDISKEQKFYNTGWDDGYQKGYEAGNEEKLDANRMMRQVEAMQGLLDANARVLRIEIEKQVREENRTSVKES